MQGCLQNKWLTIGRLLETKERRYPPAVFCSAIWLEESKKLEAERWVVIVSCVGHFTALNLPEGRRGGKKFTFYAARQCDVGCRSSKSSWFVGEFNYASSITILIRCYVGCVACRRNRARVREIGGGKCALWRQVFEYGKSLELIHGRHQMAMELEKLLDCVLSRVN